jgi:hypothetical protein|tara:strand:- start:302 stop:412 length:111 start_codon:yes stop_codon:yes gene_type:complete
MKTNETIKYIASEVWCAICDIVGFCEHLINKMGFIT